MATEVERRVIEVFLAGVSVEFCPVSVISSSAFDHRVSLRASQLISDSLIPSSAASSFPPFTHHCRHHRHRIDKYLDTLLANQPISDGEATDRCKSLRRKMADCPS